MDNKVDNELVKAGITIAPADYKLICNFCGAPVKDVRKMIAGPGVYICDDCVGVCCEILEEEFSKEISKSDTNGNKQGDNNNE